MGSASSAQAKTKGLRRRGVVIPAGVLIVVGAVVAVMMLTAGLTSSPRVGTSPNSYSEGMSMDHDHAEMPASTPSPTSSADMPGMSPEEHGKRTEPAADRPLAPVLGTFGGGTSAVLISAGLLRRRDRARSLAKQAARAARRTRK